MDGERGQRLSYETSLVNSGLREFARATSSQPFDSFVVVTTGTNFNIERLKLYLEIGDSSV